MIVKLHYDHVIDVELCHALEVKFGREHQLAVTIEELAELQKKLTKAIRGKVDDMAIAEEIADVIICIDQLLVMFDPGCEKLEMFKDFKLKRLQRFYIDGEHK